MVPTKKWIQRIILRARLRSLPYTSLAYRTCWFVLPRVVFGFQQTLHFMHLSIELDPLFINRLRDAMRGNPTWFEPCSDRLDSSLGRGKDVDNFLRCIVLAVLWRIMSWSIEHQVGPKFYEEQGITFPGGAHLLYPDFSVSAQFALVERHQVLALLSSPSAWVHLLSVHEVRVGKLVYRWPRPRKRVQKLRNALSIPR